MRYRERTLDRFVKQRIDEGSYTTKDQFWEDFWGDRERAYKRKRKMDTIVLATVSWLIAAGVIMTTADATVMLIAFGIMMVAIAVAAIALTKWRR